MENERVVRLPSGRVARTNAPAGVGDDELIRQLRGIESQAFGRPKRSWLLYAIRYFFFRSAALLGYLLTSDTPFSDWKRANRQWREIKCLNCTRRSVGWDLIDGRLCPHCGAEVRKI